MMDPLMSIQFMSDLHVEFPNTLHDPSFPCISVPTAPYLALLGDIGSPYLPSYIELLSRVSPLYKRIFVVAGNHEFYKNEYFDTKQKLRQVCSNFGNVVFMDRDSEVLDNGVRVIGVTLWSSARTDGEKKYLEGRMNDYRLIKIMEKIVTATDTNQWFEEDLKYVKEQLEISKRERRLTVVLSHHVPLDAGLGFGTNLEDLMGSPLCCWLYGHTHYSQDCVVKGTRVASNQLGYITMGERCPMFNVERAVDIFADGTTSSRPLPPAQPVITKPQPAAAKAPPVNTSSFTEQLRKQLSKLGNKQH